MCQSFTRHANEAERLDREITLPRIVRNLLEPSAIRAARAIDENVDPAERFDCAPDRRLDLRGAAFEVERDNTGAQLRIFLLEIGGERFAAFGIASEQTEMHALVRECERNRTANTAAGTR